MCAKKIPFRFKRKIFSCLYRAEACKALLLIEINGLKDM